MTNYEKICAIINAWHYAIAEYDGGEIKFTDIPEQGRLCYNHGRCDEGRVSGLNLTRIYPLPRPTLTTMLLFWLLIYLYNW